MRNSQYYYKYLPTYLTAISADVLKNLEQVADFRKIENISFEKYLHFVDGSFTIVLRYI